MTRRSAAAVLKQFRYRRLILIWFDNYQLGSEPRTRNRMGSIVQITIIHNYLLLPEAVEIDRMNFDIEYASLCRAYLPNGTWHIRDKQLRRTDIRTAILGRSSPHQLIANPWLFPAWRTAGNQYWRTPPQNAQSNPIRNVELNGSLSAANRITNTTPESITNQSTAPRHRF